MTTTGTGASAASLTEAATFLGGFLSGNHATQNMFDVAILVLHGQFVFNKYRCVSISDSKKEDWRELPSPPPGWNASNDSYAFIYCPAMAPSSQSTTRNSSSFSSSTSILVKGLKMNSTLLLHVAERNENDTAKSKILSIEVQVEDFIREERLTNENDDSKHQTNYSCKDLDGLITLYDSAIFSKLSSRKPIQTQSNNPQNRSRQSYSDDDYNPLRIAPRNPSAHPIYSDGRYDGNHPLRPLNDLDPLAIPSASGNMIGPNNFPYPAHPYRPGGINGPPDMMPRFDPYGPIPGMGEPDFDELAPPGVGRGPARNPPGIGDPNVNPFPGARRPDGGGRFGGPGFGGPGFGGPRFGGFGGGGGGFI